MKDIATVEMNYTTKYKNISNKTIDVRHSVVLSEKSRREIEDEIVEELYKIFTKK